MEHSIRCSGWVRCCGSCRPVSPSIRSGWDAMLNGDDQVITGWQNKMQAVMSHILPAEQLAKRHTKEAESGTAKH